MKILVTAGNTQTPIDRVRCLTNIFTGRTGGRIALEAHRRGHQTVLLTSHPELIVELAGREPATSGWAVRTYRTFDDLHRLMAEAIPAGGFDVVIHAAAVSDYALGGVYVPGPGTRFDSDSLRWHAAAGPPSLRDAAAGKVNSRHEELWLRLVPTPKLVNKIRADWDFRGLLVKFKLEVGLGEEELLRRAEIARLQSAADLMVANTLESMNDWAYVGPLAGRYEKAPRVELAARLLQAVEITSRALPPRPGSSPLPQIDG